MKSFAIFVILFNIVPQKVFSFYQISSSEAQIEDINSNQIDTFSPIYDEFEIEKDYSKPLTEKDFENGRKLNFEQLYGTNITDIYDKLYDRNLFEGDILIDANSPLVCIKKYKFIL